jgi:ribosomal protein L37AE/L43A
MSEITEADFLEGRDNWREAYAQDATTGDCPDCGGRGAVMGADSILLCSRCDATGETMSDYTPTTEDMRDNAPYDEDIFYRWLATVKADTIKGLLPKGAEFFPEDGGIVFEGKVYFPADYVLSRRDIAAISEAAWDEGRDCTGPYPVNPWRGEQ